MVDIILTHNTRPACAGSQLIRYIAGGVFVALASKGLNVRFVDLISDQDSSVVSQQDPAAVCCYAVFFGNKVSAFRHMEKVRRAKKSPHLIIVFGAFASVFSDEILTRGLADVVVIGEPEFVIPAVLSKINSNSSLETIPNLFYLHHGKIVHTSKDFSYDLDDIPFIAPFLCSQGHHPAVMITTRGCRHHCVFCDRNVLWGGGRRQRSVDNVLREIKDLVDNHHIKQIDFLDEDFAADHKHLARICQGIRDMKAKFSWNCSVCVDSVNKEILWLMRLVGCRGIYFGVESASSKVLHRLGKSYGRQEILNAIQWSQEVGLEVEVMVTTGNPGEADQDRDVTLSMLEKIGKNVKVTTNRLIVLPGTALYHKGLREGRYTEESFFEDEGIVFYEEKDCV